MFICNLLAWCYSQVFVETSEHGRHILTASCVPKHSMRAGLFQMFTIATRLQYATSLATWVHMLDVSLSQVGVVQVLHGESLLCWSELSVFFTASCFLAGRLVSCAVLFFTASLVFAAASISNTNPDRTSADSPVSMDPYF